MLVNCQRCSAVVDAIIIGSYWRKSPDDGEVLGEFIFLQCPQCTLPILAVRVGFEDPLLVEIYPHGKKRHPPSNLPKFIAETYQEALTCFEAKAFTATAMMCRKTLEGICQRYEIVAPNLAQALKAMREQGIIDNAFFEWANLLRNLGNEAAHEINPNISDQDARDILDFTETILEYIFNFRERFKQFKQRRNQIPD